MMFRHGRAFKITRTGTVLLLSALWLNHASAQTIDLAAQIQTQLTAVADFAIPYLEVLVGIGILTMAVIEVLKKIFKARERYHCQRLWNWVTGSNDDNAFSESAGPGAQKGFTGEINKHRAFSDIVYLAVGERPSSGTSKPQLPFVLGEPGPENALFSLELEKMTGQLQIAIEAVLSNPETYPDAYRFVSLGTEEDQEDRRNWINYAREPYMASDTEEERDNAAAEAKHRADTYTRLHDRAQRKLDTFQLRTAYKWQRLNHLAAFLIGAGLLFTLLSFRASGLADVAWIFVVAVFGGVVAPLAKDLMVSVQRLRSPG